MFSKAFFPHRLPFSRGCWPLQPALTSAVGLTSSFRVLQLALAGLLALGISYGAVAQGGAVAQVEVTRAGETYSVHASAQLAADQRLIWETLTDYERLREFVPGVTRARVLTRYGNQLSIEQVGVFTVFLFDLPVQLRLAVEHTPYTSVLARLAPGGGDAGESTLRSFTGRYTLTPVRPPPLRSVRLDYDAQFELAAALPAMIGRLFAVSAVRQTMREQFEAMLREIERRQARLANAEDAR